MSLRKYTHHIRPNFLLAYPVMLSMLGQVMTGVADSVMVGWTGATPLAASSFANIFFSIPLFFGVGVSYAITPLVAQAEGANDQQKIIDTLKNGALINIITAFVLVGLIFSVEPFMPAMGQPDEVVTLAIPYLSIIGVSIIPTMIFQTYRQFAEGLQRTRVAMIIVVGSNLLNILLNYLLIFGAYGFPELGLNGAGWATLISRTVMALSMMLYIYYGKKYQPYHASFSFGNYTRSLISKMLHIGIPAGSQFIFEVGAFGLSALMMGWIGTTALAAHQIAINLATISYMTTSGLGAAATIRVGNFLGQGDIRNLRGAAFTMMGMAVVIMLAWAVLFIFGRYFLPTLYIDDQSVIELTATLLITAALFQLSDGIQVVTAGALRGLQDVKIPSLLIFVAYWIIALPLGYLFAFPLKMGAQGIWIGLFIGLTLTATAMVIRFHRLSKKHQSET
ncbi:MAG: MATE family efflux transporter [Cyclobacteriaceae bacterium]|nr:MATE family efflux transporter [Cyclobacteriaceae bacterium]